jgi:Phosphatidylinositol-specific phospholipase C, X domain/Phosphatidylinositol-specific phospholipase C, Y domain
LDARRLAITADRRNLVVTTPEADESKSNSNAKDGFGLGAFKVALEDLSLFGSRDESAAVVFVSFHSIDRIEHGALSHRHLLASQLVLHGNGSTKDDGGACPVDHKKTLLHRNLRLSVVYRVPKGYETLDLIVPNEHHCATMYRAVRDLLALRDREAGRVPARLRVLDDAWVEVLRGKAWRAPVDEDEFLRLREHFQVTLSRGVLSDMFRDACKRSGRGLPDGVLDFEFARRLLDAALEKSYTSPGKNVALEKLWHELVELDPIPAVRQFHLFPGTNDEPDEPSISAAAFYEFLRGQNENVTLQSAIDLVQAWNQQSAAVHPASELDDGSLQQDRLAKSMFFAYLTSDANDIMSPERARIGSDDMDKPLHHYYISTSHDTYLKKLPNSFRKLAYFNASTYDAVDEQAYAVALLRGVRCVELTVWDGLDGANPVVSRRKPTKAKHPRLAFEVVIRVVRRFLEGHPDSFPVLLKIENHASTAVQERIAVILHKQLERTGLLAKPPAARSMEDKSFVLPSPSSIRGKVVVLGKRTKLCKNLVWNNDFDADLASFDSIFPLRESSPSDRDEEAFEDDSVVVVGFDANGPIREQRCAQEPNAAEENSVGTIRTVGELVQIARYEAEATKSDVERANERLRELMGRANDLEAKAARFTVVSGWAVEEVKARAVEIFATESIQSVAEFPGQKARTGADGRTSSTRHMSTHRGLYCHQEVDEEDVDTSNASDANEASNIDVCLVKYSPSNHLKVERTEHAKNCARKVETLLTSRKKSTASMPFESNASPNAVADHFPGTNNIVGNSPQVNRMLDEFLEARSQAREWKSSETNPTDQSFTSFVEERVLARDLASIFEKEQSGGSVLHHDQIADEEGKSSPHLHVENRSGDKSCDTVPFHPVEAAPSPSSTGYTTIVGREAANAYVEALKARQEAGSIAEGLVMLQRKAMAKEQAHSHALKYKETMSKLARVPIEMSRLTYFHSTRHAHWSKSIRLSSFQFHSFSQSILLSMLRKCPIGERKSVVAFTKSHLCRVFWPWESVGTSKRANVDPVLAWSLGCQLVSCNFHSADEALLVANGLFRQNGNCGYVLKPAHLREHLSQLARPQKWSFRILSGHNLLPPKDTKAAGVSSPLVKISVYSGSESETCISVRTRPARHGGLDQVIWDAPAQQVDLVSGSLVSFSVWHRKENGAELFMGASVLPSSCLREGYRSVALLDEDHVRAGASCLLIQAERLR